MRGLSTYFLSNSPQRCRSSLWQESLQRRSRLAAVGGMDSGLPYDDKESRAISIRMRPAMKKKGKESHSS